MPGLLRSPLRHRVLSLVVGAVLVASCIADDPVTVPTPSALDYAWGEEAELWIAGFDQAVDTLGGAQFSRMLAADSTHDYRSMDPAASYPVQNRASTLRLLSSIIPARSGASVPEGWNLISIDGLISFTLLDWSQSGYDTLPVTHVPAHLANVYTDVGPSGARSMVTAISVQSMRERSSAPHVVDGALQVADDWMAAWGTDELAYADEATITDSIGGGRALAESKEPPPVGGWQISRIAAEAAVYPLSFSRGSFDGAVFVVEAVEPEHCPNRLGIVAEVEEGLIVQEDRYWLASEARRCIDQADLPTDGWWVGRDLSFRSTTAAVVTEDLETITGTIVVDGHEVELKNGTDELDRAIEWALSRFSEAGLTAPRVSTITFSDYLGFCSDIQGRAVWEGDTWDLYFCFGEDELCCPDSDDFRAGPMRTVLHELSHAWLRQNLDDDTRSAFQQSVGLESWADPTVPWASQAREHAAETMSWGLLDTHLRMINIGGPSVEVLTDGFRLLTGVDPLPKNLE